MTLAIRRETVPHSKEIHVPHCVDQLFAVDGVLITSVDEHGADIEVDFLRGRAITVEGMLCIALTLPEIQEDLPRSTLALRIIAGSATKGDYSLSKEGNRWLVWKNYSLNGERFLEDLLVAHARFTRALSSALRRPLPKPVAPKFF
jgi:hypothetical protein